MPDDRTNSSCTWTVAAKSQGKMCLVFSEALDQSEKECVELGSLLILAARLALSLAFVFHVVYLVSPLYTKSFSFNMIECWLAPTSTWMPSWTNQHPDARMDKAASDAG
jgi:hypothetical protein